MPHVFLIIALIGSALGLVFSSVSTYDFVAHLDRQVHGLHCSFLPGMSAPDASGASGCHVTLMSPYSSFMREQVWGGIPISLPAMATFAFLLFWGGHIALTQRTYDRRATGFFALASLVPLLASLVMGTIAVRELDAFCKLCVGIYVASALTAIGAYGTYRRAVNPGFGARRDRADPLARTVIDDSRSMLSRGALIIAALIGIAFVATSTLAYALNAPDFTRFVAGCGTLPNKGDPAALLTLGDGAAKATSIIEVLDPLCPACRAFERRFESVASSARRSVLLFPLDNKCNWMVNQAIHPGACAVSEALLCAGDAAEDVLEWALDHQDEIIEAERSAPGSAEKRVVSHFPALKGCVGSSKARARLNRALRWAVDNQLPVLTPQLYVNGKRLCDADTDLGLDYILSHMLDAR